jgi:hypothetical protein
MKRIPVVVVALLMLGAVVGLVVRGAGAAPPEEKPVQENASQATPATSVEEARHRARLLHEAVHATLQIVHHEYYREDEGLLLPASTLKKVFREMANRQKVELRWIAVNAQAMNADHTAETDFEKGAVKALTAGADEFEQMEQGVYRRAGPITLGSDCLKCHVPSRTSTHDRTAGLIIAMPVELSAAE